MSATKTSQISIRPSALDRRPSESTRTAASPNSRVDTSNLTPGAAARYEKLMRSIDDFTDAVRSKAITIPERK